MSDGRAQQCWYADDSAIAGSFETITKWFNKLLELGPAFGYLPEPTKSVLVVKPELLQQAEATFSHMGVAVTTGQRYLGGVIGTQAQKDTATELKVQTWSHHVERLSCVAVRYPQTAHSALSRSLQAEWDFCMRVTPTDQEIYQPLSHALREKFLPALFDAPLSAAEKDLKLLPTRHGGLGIRNPLRRAAAAHAASTEGTSVARESLCTGEGFNTADHQTQLRSALKLAREAQEATEIDVAQQARLVMEPNRRRVMDRHTEHKTSGWLTSVPSLANHTDLPSESFRDALHLRYGKTPPTLPPSCDGCGAGFTIDHALNCKKGGLIIQRHDEVRDVIGDLCSMAWGAASGKKEVVLREGDMDGTPGVRTDLLVRGVWQPQVMASFDLCVVNADASCYRNHNRTTASVLKQHETAKKAHHRLVAEDRRIHFTPLAVTVDGVWGREAGHFLKRLASTLCEREGWRGRGYSQVLGWIRARLSTALVRATARCLRGSRVPWRGLGCEDGAGMWRHD